MGLIGMGLYAAYWGILLLGGGIIRSHTRNSWPALGDLGWTFQLQGICLVVGGSFCPSAWNPPMMILSASVSALLGLQLDGRGRELAESEVLVPRQIHHVWQQPQASGNKGNDEEEGCLMTSDVTNVTS